MRMLLGLIWLLHWLPLPILGRLGEALGSVLYWAIPKRRRIALTNLALCLPHLAEEERRILARRHFQAYTRSILERGILWWAPESRLRKLIHIEPKLPLEEIQSGPTILLCPHFVCLDVAGAAVAMDVSASSVYMEQRNKIADAALRRGRSRFKPVKLLSRAEGIKPILRSMREGMPYFMLPDLDFGLKDAEFVPFFGVPAATLTAPARIAAATGAKVIPVIATFLPNYRGWKVKFYPPVPDYPGQDLLAATRRMNAFIEDCVLDTPAEYLWTHKRFKTRPPGTPGFYD